jgi:uncharacterized SAM-binding protein YcdF (DUF218 family)
MTLDPALIEAINRYLLVRTDIEPADLCFVFGTRTGVNEFADETTRLWSGGFFPRVLISGGVTPGDGRSEAIVMREKLIERGVSSDVIFMEERATNTGENVEFSLPVIERAMGLANVKSLIAIGKFRTSRRYLMTLQRHWPEVRKMFVPVHYHNVAPERWMDHAALRDGVLAEWARIVPYFEKGFIQEVDLPGTEFRPKGAM